MKRFEDKKNKPSSATTEKTASQTSNDVSTTKITQKKKLGKKRNWACVVYPESLPDDWLDTLQKTGLQIAISPLHNKDLEADGTTPKKPHYHIILIYSGPTSFAVVRDLTDKLNAPIPVPLEAVRGYYRYLTHQDNPEKYQYDEKEIQHLNGFSIFDFVELTKSEVIQIKKILIEEIKKNDLSEYSTFVDYVMNCLSDNEVDVAFNHTFFFDKYLTSCRHKRKPVSKMTEAEIAELSRQALESE
jgi:hypothetical protein